MIQQHKLDLQLTCLEFEGLTQILRHHANYYVGVGDWLNVANVSEDNLLLGHYYLTVVRPIEQRGTWQRRDRLRSRTGLAKRYVFPVNFLLARVLFRVLYTWPFEMSNAEQALLAQLHRLLVNLNALPAKYMYRRAVPLPDSAAGRLLTGSPDLSETGEPLLSDCMD